MRNILITITSVLILLGAGAYYLFFSEQTIWNISYKVKKTAPITSYETTQSRLELENTKNIELYNAAIRDQDIHLCDAIVVINTKNECRDIITATIAKKTGHIESCETLSNSGVSELCRDTIHTDVALHTLDSKNCEGITNGDRKTFCQESVDELVFRGFVTTQSVTADRCKTLGNKYQKKCIAEIHEVDELSIYRNAITTSEVALCATITSSDLKSMCLDTINLKTAITAQNSVLCEKLENPEKRLYCISQVSKGNDIALYKSAMSHTDTEMCSRISNENLRNKCHDTLIMITVKSDKNITQCDSLTNSGMILTCQQFGQ